jgi:uncharacterized membrane protein
MRFLGTTFVGGLLVILPVYLAVLLLLKAVGSLVGLLKPVAELVPDSKLHPNLIAAVVVVVACFLAGLVAREFPKTKVGQAFQEKVLERIPGYSLVRTVTRSLVGDRGAGLEMVLVEMEDGLVIGVVIERHDVRWAVLSRAQLRRRGRSTSSLPPGIRWTPFGRAQAAARYGHGQGPCWRGSGPVDPEGVVTT